MSLLRAPPGTRPLRRGSASGCSPPSSARHHARLAAQASTHTRTHTLTHATRTHRTYRRLTPHTPHTARGCLSVYESCTKHRAKTGVEVERVVYIIVPTERITAVLVKSFKSEKVHSPKRKKEVFSLRWAPREIRHGTSTTTTTTTTTLNINNNSHMRMCSHRSQRAQTRFLNLALFGRLVSGCAEPSLFLGGYFLGATSSQDSAARFATHKCCTGQRAHHFASNRCAKPRPSTWKPMTRAWSRRAQVPLPDGSPPST